MRWTNRVIALLGVAVASSTVNAVPAGELKENYQSIIERNPFGLKPIPPPPTNNAAPVKEKPKTEIFLTGITSFPKMPKQAYFYTREQGKKDPTYYALTEGDSKDGIKILTIDPQQRKVRVNMDSGETLLSFDTHGVPVAAAAGRPGMPGVPGALPVPGQPGQPQPGQPLPMPTAPNAYNPAGQPGYQNTGAALPTTSTGYESAAAAQRRQIPTRRIRGQTGQPNDVMMAPGVTGNPQQQMQEQPERDPAEQYIRMHLNRAAQERERGIPMPPLPTIPGTE